MAGPVAPLARRPQFLEPIGICDGIYKLAEVVVQIAIRVLFVGTSIFMAAAAFPASLHAGVIPLVAISTTFLASSFFPKPVHVVPDYASLPPLIRPSVAQPIVEPPAVVIPAEQPRGLNNAGQNCAFNSLTHFLQSDPQLAAWLRAPLRDDMTMPAFANFLAGYNAPPRLIADFANFPAGAPPVPIPVRFRNFIDNYVQNDMVDFGVLRNIQDMYRRLMLLQGPLANFFAAYDQGIQENQPVANGSDTQTIRTAVHQVVPYLINPSAGVQEDAAEILTQILDVLPDAHKIKFQEATQYNTQGMPAIAELPDATRRRETLFTYIPLTIDRNQNAAQLQTLIQNFCIEDKSRDDKARFMSMDGTQKEYQPVRCTRTFLEFPNALRFQIARFHNAPPAKSWLTRILPSIFPSLAFRPEKLEIPVDVPEELTITRADGQQRRYRLASFVNHHGSSIRSGHYTASLLVNGQNYHMNDASVTLAGREESAARRRSSYLLCYIPA